MSIANFDNKFVETVERITDIGKAWHSNDILENAKRNLPFCHKTFKDITLPENFKKKSGIIVSAGPSLHKFDALKKIKESGYEGSIIAIDGSLVKCLKNGIIPDYVLTLDPHPTRVIRWFGDYELEKNSANDDYFKRQDLDVDFRRHTERENQFNIELINKYASQIKLIICSSVASNVAERAIDAGFDCYWWNPIVDDHKAPNSLTRSIFEVNKMSCMNTGGTVGTAAWVFASAVLGVESVALTGMDLGYHSETPIEMTQTYYELLEFAENREELESLFPSFIFPPTGETYYTDPTYYWYRKNFLQLLEKSTNSTVNCSEAGTLFSEKIPCQTLASFLSKEV